MKRRTLTAAVLALGLVAGSSAPALAWNPFTEPPRVFWCSVWPTFCNN